MSLKATFLVDDLRAEAQAPVLGQQEVALTDYAALKKAETMARLLPGTAALRIITDDETGELESAAILATFGQVSDDFAEQLMGR